MSSQKPLISVIMPCYNSARYLKNSINSILSQTYDNFEFIIVNDGSTDETDQVIRSFSDLRIKYYKLGKNGGNYKARNVGLSYSRGKYICVMDADDESHPDRLNIQVNVLETNKKIGCVYCNANLVDENGLLIRNIKTPSVSSEELATLLLVRNLIIHPTLMLRKEFMIKYNILYNQRLKSSSDYWFINECVRNFEVVNLNETLLNYRIHQLQISSTKHIEQKNNADLIRLELLKVFSIRMTMYEKDVYLKLIHNFKPLTTYEIDTVSKLLNRILSKNLTLKIYDNDHLYDLFETLIIINQIPIINHALK